MNCTEYNPIKYLFCLNFSDPKILQWVNFFSTQLYSKTPMETLEPRLSRYLVWWLCINLQFSIEDFYIQVQLSDCEECLTVCIYSLNGNILLEISTFYVNAPTFTTHLPLAPPTPPEPLLAINWVKLKVWWWWWWWVGGNQL